VEPAAVALSVSSTSAAFSATDQGLSSPAQTVTLKNKSSLPAALSGISISGTESSSFSQTNNCGSALAAGASCSIDLGFHPEAEGALTAKLSVTPSKGSALQVSLSGTAIAAPVVAFTSNTLSFPSTEVGATASIEYTTLTNTGTATLTFSGGFAISGPFAFGGTGTCGASVAPKSSCTISVVFKPTASGTAAGSVKVADNIGTQTIVLSGKGQ
jgi:hypothetical protein